MPKRMVTPKLNEVSGVDHPAHLSEGWLLMKALGQDPEGNTMPEATDEAAAFEKALAELPEPIRKAMIEQQRQAAEATEMAKALYDEREDAKFTAVAKSLSHLATDEEGEFSKSLRTLAEAAPEAYAVVEKALAAAEEAVATSVLFKEIGSAATAPGSAIGKLEAIAKSLQEAKPDLTAEEAFAEAAAANSALYNQHLAEV